MKQTNKLITVILCCLTWASHATVDDLIQEVHIDASSNFVDIKNKRVIYTGPVKVTQGSIKIQADKLSASQGDGETILIATGKPATYSQLLNNNQPATASAQEIHYNISKKVLTLSGDAKIEQDGSKFSAPKIIYDIQLQQMHAGGIKHPEDRVHTVIKPENFQDEIEQIKEQKADIEPQNKGQNES